MKNLDELKIALNAEVANVQQANSKLADAAIEIMKVTAMDSVEGLAARCTAVKAAREAGLDDLRSSLMRTFQTEPGVTKGRMNMLRANAYEVNFKCSEATEAKPRSPFIVTLSDIVTENNRSIIR